jgi:hypothetical protein
MTNAPFEGAGDGSLPAGASTPTTNAADDVQSGNLLQFPTIDPTISDPVEQDELIDYTVQYGDESFVIEEPDAGTVLAFIQFATNIATRAERYKSANFAQTLQNAERARAANAQNLASIVKVIRAEGEDASVDNGVIDTLNRAVNGDFGMLRAELISFASVATQDINDFIRLLALTFFGQRRMKDGEQYFRTLAERDPKGLKVAPLITALWYRFELSEDLRDALKNFQRVQGRMQRVFPAKAKAR